MQQELSLLPLLLLLLLVVVAVVVLVGLFNSLYSGPAAMRARKELVKEKNKKCIETNKQTEDTSHKAYTKYLTSKKKTGTTYEC